MTCKSVQFCNCRNAVVAGNKVGRSTFQAQAQRIVLRCFACQVTKPALELKSRQVRTPRNRIERNILVQAADDFAYLQQEHAIRRHACIVPPSNERYLMFLAVDPRATSPHSPELTGAVTPPATTRYRERPDLSNARSDPSGSEAMRLSRLKRRVGRETASYGRHSGICSFCGLPLRANATQALLILRIMACCSAS